MIGSVVGNYKIIDKIGEGGMGAVFKGVDLMLEREVAIKMLRPELARQPNVVERFRTEAVTLAKLNHSNVATLHSFFRQGEDFFMVMEFVRGETLDKVIRQRGAMPCDRAVELFCQALEGIDHAHRMGIVHRDIKPANMMLTELGSVKVMDFGIARVLGTDRLTKTGHLIGTVEYMSPEQVRGEETDARSDIYSLGILLYEMLTGRVPFNSTSEYELMRSHIEEAPTPPGNFAQIPVIVEQAIMRSLAKRREARQQSASEFRTMLQQTNTAAVTRPDTVPASPASYVTRASDPLIASAPAEQVLKETRLAGATEVAAAQSGRIGETRLATDAIAQPAAYQPLPQQYEAAPPQAASSLPGLLARLNWKHYAGAAAALIALISLPILLIGGSDKPTVTQPAVVAQPAQAAPTGAAESTGSNATQPSIPPQTSPPVSFPALDQSGAGGAGSPKATGTQTSRASKAVQSSDSRSGAAQGDSRASAQKKSGAQPRDAETARRSESQKDTAKKSKAEKVVEAAGAVGGAIKSVGGLFGKKKKP